MPLDQPPMVIEMKYSLAEIDQMRTALRKRNVASHPAGGFGGGTSEWFRDNASALAAWNNAIENKLRTYMANGTTPADLELEK